MTTGIVLFYDRLKGWGFIAPVPDEGQKDIFVHHINLAPGIHKLLRGQKVTFDVEVRERGPVALNVRPEEQSTDASETGVRR